MSRCGCVVLALAFGCAARVSDASTDDGATTSSSTTWLGESSSNPSSSETTTTAAVPDVAAPIDCFARNEQYECAPMDCAAPIYQFECGSIWVDDDGCMRPFCKSDADCPAERECFKFVECDPEAFCWTFAGCGPIGDECVCGAVGGCPNEPPPIADQTGICIPAELRPC